MSSLVDTFGIPSAAFKTGLQIDRGKRDLKIPEDVTNRHLLLYNGIIDYIPGLESELDNISSKKLNIIISMVSKGMSDGRSADLSSVKHKGLQYIGLNMYSKADALDPPIPEIEDKSMRGLNHPQLARLLCPRKKLDWFDEDPDSAMAALQSGEITMTAYNWPTFFYEHDVYDAAEKTNGLFRNHIVVRFYKHLFIGPSSVTNDSSNVRNSAKPSKNRAWGLTAVNKYIIAYIHVITYFTISSAQHWTRYIGDMDLDELLWAIVEMLDDDDDPWVKDTLVWWNRHLKPTKENSKSAKLLRKESENDIAQIRAQRAARRSAVDKSAVLSHPINHNETREPSTSGKRTRPAEHHDEEDAPRAPKRIRQASYAINSPRPRKANTQRNVSIYDNDEEVTAPQPKPAHPRPDGQYRPFTKSLPQRHVIISDDEEDQPAPPRKPMPRQHHLEIDSGDHTPPPRKLKSKHPDYFSDTIDDEQEALPPKFKARYEAASYDGALASMRAGQPTLHYDGKEQQPRLSKHPASASVHHHHDDKDQPPRPKPKPKPKPRHTVHEHEDSVSELVTEQSGMNGQSQPAPVPVLSPCPSSLLSQLTDNDNDLLPQAARLFDAPLAPSKQKGKKKATTAPGAPRRISGRRKNGY